MGQQPPVSEHRHRLGIPRSATTLKVVIDATGHDVVTRLEPSHDTIIDTQGAGDHATQFVKTRASAEQSSQIADPLTR